ncbi:glycoside hydrolase family 18 protein [Legionella maceachernii]|uniref:chitinase n=1 Tax=Legionella maceachernii TaxID=466 RepID=A0A0W0VZS8_9GAMM|nr:glycoside hydrolase family 18 protein [Legionella maceachernii]KTD25546.1 Chitinase A1 precursor [Legionella maceachernii]SJZ55810.1 chitinase [Legionella maceachernii]SUP00471.1 Chitinase A1 precursor [Legionella maceachernii]
MKRYKKMIFPVFTALFFPMIANASLTLYTTGWSMYGDNAYEYDGAYKNGQPYGQLKYVANPDMVAQFNKADIVAWSFMQVWNSKDPNQAQYPIPASWDGLMHFSDLWGELPFEASWVSLPPETNEFLTFCRANEGACSSVQVNGNTGVKELFTYTDQKGVGQLNSFGAFIHSNKYTAKRIIAIGGANTVSNKGISSHTFDAIFANQSKFLNQFKAWMTQFKNLKGVDYDFEPPIDSQTGAQLLPDAKTLADYNHLYELVKASRQTLGPDTYISVTITVNKEYLAAINQSVEGGWFKQIAQYADSVNLMTYDLHGPWSQSSDPYTSIHAYLKQPETSRKDEFAINYATDSVTEQVLAYGMPKEKLQIGLAAYGRGFSGVPQGEDSEHPGFEQPWAGPSQFTATYTNQEGMLPYKSVDRVINELGYKPYLVRASDVENTSFVTGAYLYSFSAKQFVGYQSPEVVKSVCEFVKQKGLKGAIMWSADTDLPVSNAHSLVAAYKDGCN